MRAGCRGAERGFVLVAVLFVATLLLGSAVSFALFARNEVRRSRSEEFALEARSLAVIAFDNVSEWIALDKNDFDSAREPLYSPSIPIMLSFGEWRVFVRIVPQGGLIPINDLFLPDGVTVRKEYLYPWREIWTLLGRQDTASLVLDFLDGDAVPRVGSREDESFPNRSVSDLSELLHLPEIDRALLYGNEPSDLSLSRFFSVYGDHTVNVNIAPGEVLGLLDPDLGPDNAKAIVAYRTGAVIRDAKNLIKIPGFPRAAITRLKDIIGYKSIYFSVNVKVQKAADERSFTAIMKRSDKRCEIVNWRE